MLSLILIAIWIQIYLLATFELKKISALVYKKYFLLFFIFYDKP